MSPPQEFHAGRTPFRYEGGEIYFLRGSSKILVASESRLCAHVLRSREAVEDL